MSDEKFHPEIETAAQCFIDARYVRKQKAEFEAEAGRELIRKMNKHNLSYYRFQDGREVHVESKEKVSVKLRKR